MICERCSCTRLGIEEISLHWLTSVVIRRHAEMPVTEKLSRRWPRAEIRFFLIRKENAMMNKTSNKYDESVGHLVGTGCTVNTPDAFNIVNKAPTR